MLSSNVDTFSMVMFAFTLIIAIMLFVGYALIHSTSTQTLADSVRIALINNRDDSARVNSKTLYALDVSNFEKEVEQTRLSEVKQSVGGRVKSWAMGSLDRNPNGGTNFRFYYLLQNGQLYDTETYKKKLEDGSNTVLNKNGKPTLIKAVTVDATIDKNSINSHVFQTFNKDTKEYEQVSATRDGRSKRYSVTYVIDGGLVKNPHSDTNEASRLLPDSYQDPTKQDQMVGNQKLKSNTMINLTDN